MIDGSIKYKGNEGSIHKVAAQILGAESCNGWTYWHYQEGNKLKPIDDLRQRLRTRAKYYKFFLNNFLKIFYFLKGILKKYL